MSGPSSRHPFQPALLVLFGLVGGILLMIALDRDTPPAPPVVVAPPPVSPLPEPPAVIATPMPEKTAPAPTDPINILAEALGHADRDARAESLRHLAQRLVAEDVQKALALANRIPDANDKIEFMRALFGAWATKEPKTALDYLKANIAPGLLHSESMTAAIEKWGGSNPRDAWQWLDANVSGPLKEEGMAALVNGWARRDPQSAAAWFIETGSTAQGVLDALVTTWADLNPRAAATWVETLTNGENKLTARVCLASAWVQQDPAAAAEYFTPLVTGGREGLDLASALVNAWGAADPAATAQWIDKLPNGPARHEAAGVLATIWAANDIQRAIEWTKKLEVPEMKASAIQHIGTTWGAIEPRKAIDWLATLPADQTRTDAMQGALNSWAVTNPQEMKSWIATQNPGDTTDNARVSLGEVFLDEDPSAAMDLVLGITAPIGRSDSIGKFYRHWREQDDAAAQEWLKAKWSSLPLDLQKRLEKEQTRPLRK